MKKQIVITLALLLTTTWASWQFAFAKPTNQTLSVGEVPVNQTPDQKMKRLVKVGDVTFNIPKYFAEGGGIKEDGSGFDSAIIRNIYYGQCIKRIDGRCSSPAFSDETEYSDFKVVLHAKPFNKEMVKKNFNSMKDCEKPEVLAAKSGVSLKTAPIRWGVYCSVFYEYHSISVEMIFNSGNFPRFDAGKMMEHVTAFLDKYLISTPTKQ